HFIRYAPLVKACGGRVLFECPRPLLQILADVAGVDQLVAAGSPLPAFDVHVPLLSLPGIFGTNLSNLPANVPYLKARDDLVAHWRKELGTIPGFKVGIAWQGNPGFRFDRQRSLPLASFEPLARVPGVTLISLQKGPGVEQLAENADRFKVIGLGDRF